jgi:hypothetical protein
MTFRTVVVAGSILLAASCSNGAPQRPAPAATTDAAATAPTAAPTTTERSTSVVIPRPTATPGPFGALLAVPAPFEASPAPLTVQEAQAQFTAGFQDELEQQRALVMRRPGWPEPLTLYAWRLRDERGELDFRRALYGALARSYGMLRTSRVGAVVLVQGATTGEAVAAWEPDRRTLFTIIGASPAQAHAAALALIPKRP